MAPVLVVGRRPPVLARGWSLAVFIMKIFAIVEVGRNECNKNDVGSRVLWLF